MRAKPVGAGVYAIPLLSAGETVAKEGGKVKKLPKRPPGLLGRHRLGGVGSPVGLLDNEAATCYSRGSTSRTKHFR